LFLTYLALQVFANWTKAPGEFSRYSNSGIDYRNVRANDFSDESTEKQLLGTPEDNRVRPRFQERREIPHQ
jgi:hypothetical protein